MRTPISIRIDVTPINLQNIKEENGTILTVQQYIYESIQDKKTRELFDFLIQQYDCWIEQLCGNLFEDGYRCALAVLQQVDKSLFDNDQSEQ